MVSVREVGEGREGTGQEKVGLSFRVRQEILGQDFSILASWRQQGELVQVWAALEIWLELAGPGPPTVSMDSGSAKVFGCECQRHRPGQGRGASREGRAQAQAPQGLAGSCLG